MTEHFVYLFHTKEFVDLQEPVYKIGKTTKPNFERFQQYDEGTRFYFQTSCHNCHEIEKKVIALFKKNYDLHCGREYFRGDRQRMVKDICRLIFEEEEPEIFEEVVQYWFEEAVVNDEIGKVDKITEYDVEGVVTSPPSILNSTITTATPTVAPTVTTTKKQQYRCEVCDYNTDRNAHYLKHLTSNKHFLNSHPIEFDPNCKYQCKNCNRKYMGQSGLWQHSQVCIPVTPSLVIESAIVEEPVTNDSINLETVINELKKMNERIEDLSNSIR